MEFSVTILGNNAALPAHGRNPSGQIVNHNHQLFMVDCGEGSQMRMNQYGIKRGKINHIFISHLHGDHYLGLMGLINSYRLLNRVNKLSVYAPQGLKRLLQPHLDVMKVAPQFELEIVECPADQKQKLFENDDLEVYAFPLNHGIACQGYLFQEKLMQPRVNKKKIEQYQLELPQIQALKAGKENIETKQGFVSAKELTLPPPQSRSYAYCSDTAFFPEIGNAVQQPSLLYHESSYLKDDEQKAKDRGHSTAEQAGKMGLLLGAEQLLLGHFSAKHKSLSAFKEEAEAIFPKVLLAEEGKNYPVGA